MWAAILPVILYAAGARLKPSSQPADCARGQNPQLERGSSAQPCESRVLAPHATARCSHRTRCSSSSACCIGSTSRRQRGRWRPTCRCCSTRGPRASTCSSARPASSPRASRSRSRRRCFYPPFPLTPSLRVLPPLPVGAHAPSHHLLSAQGRLDYTCAQWSALGLHLLMFSTCQIMVVCTNIESYTIGPGWGSGEAYHWWWILQDLFHGVGGLVRMPCDAEATPLVGPP